MKGVRTFLPILIATLAAQGLLEAAGPMVDLNIRSRMYVFPTEIDATYEVRFIDENGTEVRMVEGVGLPVALREVSGSSQLRVEVEKSGLPVENQGLFQIETVEIGVNTQAGHYYEVQVSSDLEEWDTLETVNGTGTEVNVVIPSVVDLRQFFRVIEIPGEAMSEGTGEILGRVYYHSGNMELILSFLEPDGAVPADGAVLTLGGAPIGSSNSDGRFSIASLPAGKHQLFISFMGLQVQRDITIRKDVVNLVSDLGTTREDAIALLQTEVLSGLANPDATLVAGPVERLPTEVVLSEKGASLGFKNVVPEDEGLGYPYLFVIDEYFTTAFEHPVRWVLVDPDNETVLIYERDNLPLLNGVPMWDRYADVTAEEIIMNPTQDPALLGEESTDPPQGSANSEPADVQAPGECDDSKIYVAMLIAENDKAMETAATRIYYALGDADIGGMAFIYGSQGAWIQQLNRHIEAWTPRMRPCDTFMFYVIGHGRKSSGTIGIRDGSFGAKTFFSSKIKTVPACHILIHADNCYSGKLIRSGGKFISKIQKQLKDKEVLMITSTDPDKGVLFWDAENKFHIAFDLVGSAVCNYFAANGVYANWRNLLGMAGQIDDAKGAFLTNTIKRHNSQYFYQLGNPAKCDPACLVEEEDNDTKEKAQVVPTNAEGGACMLGKIEQDRADVDFYSVSLMDQEYEFELLVGDNEYELDLGTETITGVGSGVVDFKLEVPTVVTIRLGGGTRKKYLWQVEPLDCVTQVYIENNTGSRLGMRLTSGSESLPINESEYLVLPDGEGFLECLNGEIPAFNILELHDDTDLFRGGDQPFAIPVQEGKRLYFKMDEFGDSWWIEDVGADLGSGAP